MAPLLRLLPVAALCLGASTLDAKTILSVSGTVDSGANVGTAGVEAVAISFTLADAQDGLSLAAPITCFACTGGVFLHSTALGSSTGVGDLIDATAFNGTSASPYFTDFDLAAGLYFMILEISSGFAIWEGSTAPLTVASSGATAGPDFVSTDVSGFVPTSTFSILNFNGGLSYDLTQATAPVPLPPTIAFSLLGLFAFGLLRRKN